MANAELELAHYYKRQQDVIEQYAKGARILDIQKSTGLPIKEVEQHLQEFREYAKQDRVIRERAKEIVLVVDQHYSDIVRQLHVAIEDANNEGDYKAVMSGLKMTADAEAKRVELLAKAGILADNTIGDQITEAEEKQAILIGILKNVTGKCSHCKIEVAKELSRVTNRVEGVVV